MTARVEPSAGIALHLQKRNGLALNMFQSHQIQADLGSTFSSSVARTDFLSDTLKFKFLSVLLFLQVLKTANTRKIVFQLQ